MEHQLSPLNGDALVVVITGAAGVGKTALARRLAYQLWQSGYRALEHNRDVPLFVDEWIGFLEGKASAPDAGRKILLVIDDAPALQRDVNRLLNSIAARGLQNVKVILTADLN